MGEWANRRRGEGAKGRRGEGGMGNAKHALADSPTPHSPLLLFAPSLLLPLAHSPHSTFAVECGGLGRRGGRGHAGIVRYWSR